MPRLNLQREYVLIKNNINTNDLYIKSSADEGRAARLRGQGAELSDDFCDLM